MKRISLISLLFFVVIAGGCSTAGALSHDVTAESNRTEKVHIVTRTEMVPVMVHFEIPKLREVRRNLKDSLDVIRNDYAVSTVRLHPDGSFDHSLESVAQVIDKTVDVPVQVTDTTSIKETDRTKQETVTITEEVNVLRLWQKVLIWFGAIALLFLAVRLTLYIIRR